MRLPYLAITESSMTGYPNYNDALLTKKQSHQVQPKKGNIKVIGFTQTWLRSLHLRVLIFTISAGPTTNLTSAGYTESQPLKAASSSVLLYRLSSHEDLIGRRILWVGPGKTRNGRPLQLPSTMCRSSNNWSLARASILSGHPGPTSQEFEDHLYHALNFQSRRTQHRLPEDTQIVSSTTSAVNAC